MEYSSEAGLSNHIRLEVQPTEQAAAYTPGDGSVVFLNDKTTRAELFNNLTETQCMVMAARFSTWADMAAEASDTHKAAAQ